MMVKLKIEQGLLMEGTKKNLGIFPKKDISFGPFPNGIKALKQAKVLNARVRYTLSNVCIFFKVITPYPIFSNPLDYELVGSLFGPHYADDLQTKSSEIEDSLGILISR